MWTSQWPKTKNLQYTCTLNPMACTPQSMSGLPPPPLSLSAPAITPGRQIPVPWHVCHPTLRSYREGGWEGKCKGSPEVWTKGLLIIPNLGEVVFETSWKELSTASLGSIISDLLALQSPGVRNLRGKHWNTLPTVSEAWEGSSLPFLSLEGETKG